MGARERQALWDREKAERGQREFAPAQITVKRPPRASWNSKGRWAVCRVYESAPGLYRYESAVPVKTFLSHAEAERLAGWMRDHADDAELVRMGEEGWNYLAVNLDGRVKPERQRRRDERSAE